MYMSYCRFEGTRAELRRCLADVEEHANGEAEYAISEREVKEFDRMVHDFVWWLQEAAIIGEDGEIDETALRMVCAIMRGPRDEE